MNKRERELTEITEGVFDLSARNFEKKSIPVLKGQCDFYWHQFPLDTSGNFNIDILKDSTKKKVAFRKTWSSINLPSKGYGTFVIRIKLPENGPIMGLKTYRVKSACEVWVNGKKVEEIGQISTMESDAIASGKSLLIRLPRNENIELVVPVSNYHHSLGGGITTPIKIAPYNQLENIKMLNLIEASVALTLAIGMGFFLLFSLFLKRNKARLYLGLFCFSILLRVLFIDEVIIYNLWPEIPFSLIQKGRYIGYYASLALINLYMRELVPEYLKKWFVYTITAICSLGILYVLVTSTFWCTKSSSFFGVIGVLCGTYMLYVSIRLLFSKKALHKWIFITILFISMLIINDMLHIKGIITTMSIGKYSILLFFFVGLQIFINYKFQKEIESENQFMTLLVDQKEMMLKEIHHRVKNNFQIVSSLLELQSKDIKDIKALQLANDGQNRLKSMAFIHQKLYQNTTGLIDFNDYLKKIVQEISTMYKSEREVEIVVHAKNIQLDVDTAIPLGLMVNEIITNAYKYAFKGVHFPSINISIEKLKNNNYALEICDNGIGLDKNIDIKKTKSTGLRLIRGFVKQLDGTMEVHTHNGTTFQISIKDTTQRKLID